MPARFWSKQWESWICISKEKKCRRNKFESQKKIMLRQEHNMVLNQRGLLKVWIVFAVNNLIHKFKKEVLEGDAVWEVLGNMWYLNQWGYMKSYKSECKQRRDPKAEPSHASVYRLGDKEKWVTNEQEGKSGQCGTFPKLPEK